MLNLLTTMIKDQEQIVAQFKKDRSCIGIGKATTLTIDFAETVAIYELQGMVKVLSRYNEHFKRE